MERKKLTITLVGVVTWSEEWTDNFSQFSEAMRKYLFESFPEWQPINPPITVTMDDISPDDVILRPVNTEEYMQGMDADQTP
jgi:hypothetical protein